jgi:hypothetical protein
LVYKNGDKKCGEQAEKGRVMSLESKPSEESEQNNKRQRRYDRGAEKATKNRGVLLGPAQCVGFDGMNRCGNQFRAKLPEFLMKGK